MLNPVIWSPIIWQLKRWSPAFSISVASFVQISFTTRFFFVIAASSFIRPFVRFCSLSLAHSLLFICVALLHICAKVFVLSLLCVHECVCVCISFDKYHFVAVVVSSRFICCCRCFQRVPLSLCVCLDCVENQGRKKNKKRKKKKRQD